MRLFPTVGNGALAIGATTLDVTNPEKLLVDAGTTTSFNLISGRGSINNYLQLNIKNASAGNTASSDVVATANNGNESVNYIDMGINGGGFSNTALPILNGANNAYLYATGNDFVIGNGTALKPIRFFTGGYDNANERMRIDGDGNMGIGNTSPTEILDVTGNFKLSGAFMPGNTAGTAGTFLSSTGAGTAPVWSALDTSSIANFSQKVWDMFSGTAPITYSDGQIGITQASGSTNGYLSNTDWTTFNNKLTTVDTTNISNFYLKVRNELSAGQGITYDSLTGVISAGSNWLMTGNSGISASNYLGTNDDKAMVLKSNNTSFLEFGRRQTLGLTQGYPDYTDDNEAVTYVRSALQFEAPNASFYKPKMFTDVNGNFRIKGSAAGTDLFEMGSTGTANNGGFEFIIGDDGDESIVFKSYHYINGMSEMMRLQSGRMGLGSNAFDATNPEKLLVDAGVTTSINLMTGKGSIDNYLQINVKNQSSGTSASSDVVATSNNGTESVNYIDMGINGGVFSNTVYPILNGPNLAYLYGTGQDMVIGNATAAKNLRFFTGGMANSNEAMRIDGTGRVGIATLTPTAKLDVGGTYKLGAAGTVLTNMIKTSASFTNNTAFNAGFTETATATVTGATANATVIVNPRTALPAGIAIAYCRVSATNTVQIAFINDNTSATAVGTIVFDITVIQ